jgi:two-component system, OmpR family, response regulator QseB
MRVLVVEDDPMIGRAVVAGLHDGGYTVDWVRDGGEAELALANAVYDLALLDLGLPRRDGLEILKSLRRSGKELPVVIITARDSVADRVVGLDNGADDYLVKPFDFRELTARLRALARRETPGRPDVLQVGDLALAPSTREVTAAGAPVELTAKEWAVLNYLMRRPGAVVSQEELLEHVWDDQVDPFTNTVRVQVGTLRRKIGRSRIETVIGQGYRLVDPAGPPSVSA